MKDKLITIVISALVVIVCLGAVGFASYRLGYMAAEDAKYETVVGVYRSDYWKDRTLVLVINEDGTCVHPFLKQGTWTDEGDKIAITIDGETTYATKVDRGVGLYYEGTFFEKIS